VIGVEVASSFTVISRLSPAFATSGSYSIPAAAAFMPPY
jgi:hypothetical protein